MSTKTAVQRETFALVLDPAVSLEESIRRGNYAVVNEHCTPKNFPLTISGPREIALFDLGGVGSSEIIRRMKAEGYAPATLDDALAIGAHFPNLQKSNPIVFLGTVWAVPGRDRLVPVLGSWGGKRGLSLYWFGVAWSGLYRFAAVRES